MRELAEEVLELQKQWTDMNTPAMRRRGVIVRDEIPNWLRTISPALKRALGPNGNDLSFEGRDGTGRKTEIPWVRFYSESHSTNAREGWYCVYLFHALGDGFYLSLGHGSTRYEGGEFRRRSPEELKKLVDWARATISPDIASLPGIVTQIHLGARKSDLGSAYADGTVAAFWYPADKIPSSNVLSANARTLATMLAKLYEQQDLGRDPESHGAEVDAAATLINRLAHPLRRRSGPGQGFGLNPIERRAVELRAMQVAKQSLEQLGFTVEDVSASQSFDFRATRPESELIVEVKGTTGSCREVLLTAQEVALHRGAYPYNALIVVHDIQLDRRRKPPSASGGTLRTILPWKIDSGTLTPSAYRYTIPEYGNGAEDVSPPIFPKSR